MSEVVFMSEADPLPLITGYTQIRQVAGDIIDRIEMYGSQISIAWRNIPVWQEINAAELAFSEDISHEIMAVGFNFNKSGGVTGVLVEREPYCTFRKVGEDIVVTWSDNTTNTYANRARAIRNILQRALSERTG